MMGKAWIGYNPLRKIIAAWLAPIDNMVLPAKALRVSEVPTTRVTSGPDSFIAIAISIPGRSAYNLMNRSSIVNMVKLAWISMTS